MEYLKITGYTDKDYQTPFEGQPYSLMLNPTKLDWNREVLYSEVQPPDSSSLWASGRPTTRCDHQAHVAIVRYFDSKHGHHKG